MIRLTPSLCIPNCKYSATYLPAFPTRFIQNASVPSIVYQDCSASPIFSNEIPCYDLDSSIKCNCTFDQQNDKMFDAYIR